MDALTKKNLYAICSWLEAYCDEIVPEAADVFYELLDNKFKNYSEQTNAENAMKSALVDLKSKVKNDAYSFLKVGIRSEKEPRIFGFGYRVHEQAKEELLSETLREVKKKKLLKNTLDVLSDENLPLSEDEKIILLLQTPQELPELHQHSFTKMLCPIKSRRTGRTKNVEIPVKVVFAGGRIKEILSLDRQKEYE